MGYVPRKVGLYGYLLELCGGSICEHLESLLVPLIIDATVSQTYVYSVVYMASHEPEKYRFSTPTYVALFATLLTAYYMWVARKIPYCYWGSDIVTLDGTPPCLKKVASRCRPKVTTTTVGRSPNCHGAQSRTRPTFKQRMGNYFHYSVKVPPI